MNWSRDELAQRSGVLVEDIRLLERSNKPDYYRQAQMLKLIKTYEQAGISFTAHGIEWFRRG